MKRFLLLILCGFVLFCFASCNETDTLNGNTYQSEKAVLPKNETTPAFDTDNISGITFYGYHDYGTGKGSEVPEKYMDEIINWLETFTVGEKAPDLMPPGTNSVHIEIVYSHGIIFESGLDTVRLDDGTYSIERDEAPPECYYEIISRTK